MDVEAILSKQAVHVFDLDLRLEVWKLHCYLDFRLTAGLAIIDHGLLAHGAFDWAHKWLRRGGRGCEVFGLGVFRLIRCVPSVAGRVGYPADGRLFEGFDGFHAENWIYRQLWADLRLATRRPNFRRRRTFVTGVGLYWPSGEVPFGVAHT